MGRSLHPAQPMSQQPSANHQRKKDVLKEYQKTIERADEAEEDDRTDRLESRNSHRDIRVKAEVKESTVARVSAESPKKAGPTNEHSSPEEKRRVISIPSANTEDDE